MSSASDLPWPRCLGVFDEESCRYFLHEVGTQIVPRYPFSFGMEEVFGIILERYGFKDMPDVTSLLHELLEDEDNAAGLGDDGDVWRSWRHGWRHRNDDVLNPFIPRFGSLILPPPTSSRNRSLKANNFVLWCESDTPAINRSQDDLVGEAEVTGLDIVVGTTRELLSSKLEGLDLDCNPTRDSSPLVSSLAKQTTRWRQRLRSLSTTGMMLLVHDARACPASSTESPSSSKHPKIEEADAASSSPTDQPLGGMVPPPDTCDNSKEVSGDCPKRVDTKLLVVHDSSESQSRNLYVTTRIPDCIKDIPDFEFDTGPSTSELFAPIDHVQKGPESTSEMMCKKRSLSKSAKPIPEDKRADLNRQARLIDGTMFTLKMRRSKPLDQIQVTYPPKLEVEERDTPSEVSCLLSKQRHSLRNNMARELRRLFHREDQNKPRDSGRKHRSVPILSSLAIASPCKAMSAAPREVPVASLPSRSVIYGLDGTVDSPQEFVAAADLNKPLPLSPIELASRLSTPSLFTSSYCSDNKSALLSVISTATSLSRNSYVRDCHTNSCTMPTSKQEVPCTLTEIHEMEHSSKKELKEKQSPVQTSRPLTYSSIAQANPFLEPKTYNPRAEARPPLPEPGKQHFSTVQEPSDSFLLYGGLAERITPSKKLPAFPDHHRIQHGKGSLETVLRELESNMGPMPMKQSGTAIPQQHRGRTPNEKAPVIPFTNITTVPETPSKRSKSPFKRRFFLPKSKSTNKIEEPVTPSRPQTPASVTKDSLKKWCDRFRYGFLTADEGQLKQEELIEAHTRNFTANSSSSSTPPNSKFPISLDPPTQAKIHSEIELIMVVTANRYLLHEAQAGRISPESVAKIKDMWEKMNRPQVVEFHYDQITQHNLIMANLDRVKLHGDAAQDVIAINSTLRGWKTMAREMSVRTFCSPDSVIRKHLHDAHRVLELLGAPLVTFLAFEDMQLTSLAQMSQHQKDRLNRRSGSVDRNVSTSSISMPPATGRRRNNSEGSYVQHEHDYSDYPLPAFRTTKVNISPTPKPATPTKVRKATGAEGAIMSLPTNLEKMRDGYTARLKAAKAGVTMKEV